MPVVVHGEDGRRMDELLRRAAAFGFAGQVAAERGGELLLHGAYGVADRAAGRPMTPETGVGIASTSKQFAAVAALRLEEQGRLSLADSLGALLPGVPADRRGVTLHQLLTHTSGIPGGFTEDFEAPSAASAVDRLFTEPPTGPPGGAWRYSSDAFNVVAAIVERAAGVPWETYVRTELLAPAAMRHSGLWSEPAWREDEVATAYAVGHERGSPATWPTNFRVRGSGDIVSTAADLLRWARALRARCLLGDDALRRMSTPQAEIGPGDAYGYGVFVLDGPEGRMVEHGGDTELGYNAWLMRRPDREVVLAITSNVRDPHGRSLRQAVQAELDAILLGSDSVRTFPEARRPTPDERASLAGTYRVGDARLHVLDDGAHLWLAADGQAALDALMPPEPDAVAGQHDATRKTAALLTALHGRDVRVPLTRALDDTTTARIDLYVEEWETLVERHGPLLGWRMLGARAGRRSASVSARLRFRDRTMTMRWMWSEGGAGPLVGSDPRAADWPRVLPVAIAPDGTALAWDPFLDDAPLRVERRADGGLRLHLADGAVEVERVGVAGWAPGGA